MKERPILFSGPMVRALLNGTKTQTRRIVKQQPEASTTHVIYLKDEGFLSMRRERDLEERDVSTPTGRTFDCPYGIPGDRLWVKETHLNNALPGYPPVWFYRADNNDKPADRNWNPSIFCTRAASRITLELTAVRVERLNLISSDDAKAEGVTPTRYMDNPFSTGIHNARFSGEVQPATLAYRDLWESINGAGSWALNPWVWVLEFRKL